MRGSRAERIPPAMLATTAVALALAGAGPNVDNPWFPLPVGRHWTYHEGDVRTVVTVTGRTRLMANGVVARVVHDESRERGVPVEITDDYYAQDAKGTVWYMGEATTAQGFIPLLYGTGKNLVDGAKWLGDTPETQAVLGFYDQVYGQGLGDPKLQLRADGRDRSFAQFADNKIAVLLEGDYFWRSVINPTAAWRP